MVLKANTPNFWETLEVHCWSADFDYEDDYLAIHKLSGAVYTPLSKAAYSLFCVAMDQQLEDDIGEPKENGYESAAPF